MKTRKIMCDGHLLQFFTKSCLRNTQLITILSDGSAGHLVALACHLVHEFVVGQRLVLDLVLHAVEQSLLQLYGRNLFTIQILKTYREEIIQRIDTEMGLDIF